MLLSMNVQRPFDHRTGHADYETDVFAWATAQREALERRDASMLDWGNLAEEIGDLGSSQLREMENRLVTILEHLLKYQFGLLRDPARGWKRTIIVQKAELARLLKRNPSLAARLEETARDVYPDGRRNALAAFEAYEPDGLAFYTARLPRTCPYEAASLADPDSVPEPTNSI